jgi:predicted nucleic acid-binding Zn ribbon protein
MALPMQWRRSNKGDAMPMTRIEELEHELRRDRRNASYTVFLVIAVIALVVWAWVRS